MTRGGALDTEAIASEIVYLKNRIGELDEGDVEEKRRLHQRLRKLQDHLSDGTPENREPEAPGNEVQYLPPT